jgi:hypothetical protein
MGHFLLRLSKVALPHIRLTSNETRLGTQRTQIVGLALLQVFENVVTDSVPTDSMVVGVSRVGADRVGGARVVPTESMVWDVSRWGEAKWGAGDGLYLAIKEGLDALNKGKRNNVQDALIAETSIQGDYLLVTDDTHLIEVTKRYGGKCISIEKILANDSAAT